MMQLLAPDLLDGGFRQKPGEEKNTGNANLDKMASIRNNGAREDR
jgi:hypothetical protein